MKTYWAIAVAQAHTSKGAGSWIWCWGRASFVHCGGTMFGKLKKPFSKKEPTNQIVLDATGFSLIHNDSVLFRLPWTEVQEIIAYKEDWLTIDCVCLGFRVSDDGFYYRVDEEIIGWDSLVKQLEQVYPNLTRTWWRDVAFPAFQTNLTTIWGTPLDDHLKKR